MQLRVMEVGGKPVVKGPQSLPYEASRSENPAYSYPELCRFPKVWDAPQGPPGDPSIPEKTGISETMTGVSDLLTPINRHTWAHDDRRNEGMRQSSVTFIRSFHHRPIGMESVVASKPQAGARPGTGSHIVLICEYSM